MGVKISSLPASSGLGTGDVTVFVSSGINYKATTTQILAAGSLQSIGVVSTDGLPLANTTPAGAGAQQFSPRIRFTGQGWKTNATAGSQAVDWIVENQPVQGQANPSTNLVFSYQINGGGYVNMLTLASTGGVQIPVSDTTAYSSTVQTIGLTGSDALVLNNLNASANFVSIFFNARSSSSSVGRLVFLNDSVRGAFSFQIRDAGSNNVEMMKLTKTGQIILPDGVVGTPSYSFQNNTNLGFYRATSDDLRITVSGADRVRFIPSTLVLDTSIKLTWGSSSVTNDDVGLERSAAGILKINNASTGGGKLIAGPINIGATSTDGVSLVNSTAAGAGAQQWSSRSRWTGQGWKTNATAGTQTVDWVVENVPVQGAATPGTNWVLSYQINAGGFVSLVEARATSNTAAFLAVRQPGGTQGTHEIQIKHDGSEGVFTNPSTNRGFSFIASDGSTIGAFPNRSLILPVTTYFGWHSNSDGTGTGDITIARVAPAVARMCAGAGTGNGWLQNSAGRARLTTSPTFSNVTLTNVSDLSITVISGRKYIGGRLRFRVNNATAASGFQLDFNGGASTWTSFEYAIEQIAGTAATKGTDIATSIATVLNYTTMANTSDAVFEVTWAGVCNNGGTLIPRFADNSGTGVLTLFVNSNQFVEDSPN